MTAVDLSGSRPAAARRWRVLLAAVLVHGLVQALLVTGDPVPRWRWGFVALTAASAAAVLVLISVVSCTIGAAPHPTIRPPSTVPSPSSVGWAAIVLGIVLAAALWQWWASLAALVAGAPVVAASGTGSGGPCRATIHHIRRRPRTSLAAAFLTVVAAITSFAVALTTGFFITGSVAAAITWTAAGGWAVVVLACWHRVLRPDRC